MNFYNAISKIIDENLKNIEEFKKSSEEECIKRIDINPVNMTGLFVRNNIGSYFYSNYTFEIKEMGLEYNFSFCSKKAFYSKIIGLAFMGKHLCLNYIKILKFIFNFRACSS